MISNTPFPPDFLGLHLLIWSKSSFATPVEVRTPQDPEEKGAVRSKERLRRKRRKKMRRKTTIILGTWTRAAGSIQVLNFTPPQSYITPPIYHPFCLEEPVLKI